MALLANAQAAGNTSVSPTAVPSQQVVQPKTRAVVDPVLLRGGDQGHPLEITLDEVVEAEADLDGEGEEEVECERREGEEEESQYEEDYSDELERRSDTPPSDVEVQSRKRSSDELEDVEADEADSVRGGTLPERARKGERYAAEDEDSVSTKLKLRKRNSEELDDGDEDGGGRDGGGAGGCGNNNKGVKMIDSSPAESSRMSTTVRSDWRM